jgi:hypothetical protein
MGSGLGGIGGITRDVLFRSCSVREGVRTALDTAAQRL